MRPSAFVHFIHAARTTQFHAHFPTARSAAPHGQGVPSFSCPRPLRPHCSPPSPATCPIPARSQAQASPLATVLLHTSLSSASSPAIAHTTTCRPSLAVHPVIATLLPALDYNSTASAASRLIFLPKFLTTRPEHPSWEANPTQTRLINPPTSNRRPSTTPGLGATTTARASPQLSPRRLPAALPGCTSQIQSGHGPSC